MADLSKSMSNLAHEPLKTYPYTATIPVAIKRGRVVAYDEELPP